MTYLHKGEWLALGIIATVVLWTAIAQQIGRIEIDWGSFVPGIRFYGLIAAFGLLLRWRGHADHLAAMFIVIGLLPVFASVLSIANMAAFPLQRPLIDETLFAIDRAFGYEWDKAVAWLAAYPAFSQLLAKIYQSSFPQMFVLVLLLGLTGRTARLHHFLLTAMITSLVTLAFWLLWPSFGPAAYLEIAPEVIAASGLVVTPDYGAVLMHFAEHGLGRVESHLVLGTVAFPSYHIVMALLVVWFARGTVAFWPALAVNLFMIPATLTHGGHHMIDLLGGGVSFAFATLLAGRLLQAQKSAAAPVPA
jgi:hypothetical protein